MSQHVSPTFLERISISPDVCFGKPCISGTRIWVSLILDRLASGETIDELLDDYSGVEKEDILACIAYSSQFSKDDVNVCYNEQNLQSIHTTMSPSETMPPQKERLPHSLCGVISCRLAVYSLVMFCVFFGVHVCQVVTFSETYKNPDTWYQVEPLSFVAINFGLWGCLLAALAAFVLGIVGVHQPRTRKVFSVLGMFVSMYPFIFIPVGITIIGKLGGGCC